MPGASHSIMPSESQAETIFRKLELRTRRLVEEQLAGEFRSTFKGRGTEFDELRPYSPGDEVRSIDWNVTARTGIPHTKRSVEERELLVHLLIDISASTRVGNSGEDSKSAAAAEIAGMLAWSAIRANDRVGLTLFSDRIEHSIRPGKGPSQVRRILRGVVGHAAAGTATDVAAALDHLGHMAHRPCLVFLLSDFLCPDFHDALAATCRRHDVVAITLRDACEAALPDAGTIRMQDAETGLIRLVDTGNPAFRAAHAARQAERHATLQRDFENCGADHFLVEIGDDYGDRLHTFLKHRQQGRRRDA